MPLNSPLSFFKKKDVPKTKISDLIEAKNFKKSVFKWYRSLPKEEKVRIEKEFTQFEPSRGHHIITLLITSGLSLPAFVGSAIVNKIEFDKFVFNTVKDIVEDVKNKIDEQEIDARVRLMAKKTQEILESPLEKPEDEVDLEDGDSNDQILKSSEIEDENLNPELKLTDYPDLTLDADLFKNGIDPHPNFSRKISQSKTTEKALKKLDTKDKKKLSNEVERMRFMRLMTNIAVSAVCALNISQPLFPKFTPIHEALSSIVPQETTNKISENWGSATTNTLQTWTEKGLPTFGLENAYDLLKVSGASFDSQYGLKKPLIKIENPPNKTLRFMTATSFSFTDLGVDDKTSKIGLTGTKIFEHDPWKEHKTSIEYVPDNFFDQNTDRNKYVDPINILFTNDKYLVFEIADSDEMIVNENIKKYLDPKRQIKTYPKYTESITHPSQVNNKIIYIPVLQDTEKNIKVRFWGMYVKKDNTKLKYFKISPLNQLKDTLATDKRFTYSGVDTKKISKNNPISIPIPEDVDLDQINLEIFTDAPKQNIDINALINGIVVFNEGSSEHNIKYKITIDPKSESSKKPQKTKTLFFTYRPDAQTYRQISEGNTKTWKLFRERIYPKLSPQLQRKIKSWNGDFHKANSEAEYTQIVQEISDYVYNNTDYGSDKNQVFKAILNFTTSETAVEDLILNTLNNVDRQKTEPDKYPTNCYNNQVAFHTILTMTGFVSEIENVLVLNSNQKTVFLDADHFVTRVNIPILQTKEVSGNFESYTYHKMVTFDPTASRKTLEKISQNPVGFEFKNQEFDRTFQDLGKVIQDKIREIELDPDKLKYLLMLFAPLIVFVLVSNLLKDAYSNFQNSEDFQTLMGFISGEFIDSKEKDLCLSIVTDLDSIDKNDQKELLDLINDIFKDAEFLKDPKYKEYTFSSKILALVFDLAQNHSEIAPDYISKLKYAVEKSPFKDKKQVLKTLDLMSEINWGKFELNRSYQDDAGATELYKRLKEMVEKLNIPLFDKKTK